MVESQEDAEALIANSPLTYQFAAGSAIHRTAQTAPTEDPQTSRYPIPQEADSGQPDEAKKSFVLHIFPTGNNKTHADLIEDYTLYRSWPTWPDTDSFVAKNLSKSLPEGEMRDALADWETGGQLVEDGDVVGKGPSYGFNMRQKKREDKMGLSELLREP